MAVTKITHAHELNVMNKEMNAYGYRLYYLTSEGLRSVHVNVIIFNIFGSCIHSCDTIYDHTKERYTAAEIELFQLN